FDFLGQNVRKYHGKLLIKPSRRSVKTPRKGPGSYQGQLASPGRAVDRATQPPAPGVGQLSLSRGEQRDLREDRPCDLPRPVAMGHAASSAQRPALDPPALLHCRP